MRRVLLALIAIGVLVVLGTRGSASSGKEKGHLVKQAAQGTVRVNQDCSFRRQAEEEINYSPADPQTSLPVRTTAASASTSAASIGRPTTATSGATSCRRSARRSTTRRPGACGWRSEPS